jgi:diadenosine tetraphosphate (Ap4A) HIT family hydrolase
MATVFTKIIDGALPGRFVWRDDDVVAFLSINPLRPGHTLVVPRQEVDQWTDASPELLGKLTTVAHRVGQAIKAVWQSPRIGLIVAGFEVPHTHLHVHPVWTMADFDFGRADPSPDPAEMDDAAVRIRAALREAGYAVQVPAD